VKGFPVCIAGCDAFFFTLLYQSKKLSLPGGERVGVIIHASIRLRDVRFVLYHDWTVGIKSGD
jgi:hypothetical protein